MRRHALLALLLIVGCRKETPAPVEATKDDAAQPSPSVAPPPPPLAQIALGPAQSACLRFADGLVVCGKLVFDLAKTTLRFEGPIESPGVPVEQVGLGDGFACARARDATVRCWGKNDRGQLGDGTTDAAKGAVRVKDVEGAVELAVATAHACARTKDGTVRCWGANDHGQLGRGTTTPWGAPAKVDGLGDVERVFAEHDVTFALRKDATAAAWGKNDEGQLGDGTTVSREKPVAPASLPTVSQIAIGEGFACGRRGDGTVFCWGRGYGKTPSQLAIEGAKSLVAGPDHACARTQDGGATCWGAAAAWPEERKDPVAKPTPVPGVSGMEALAAGPNRTCGRSGARRVLCWGASEPPVTGPLRGPVAVDW